MKDQIKFETNGLTVLAVPQPYDFEDRFRVVGDRLYYTNWDFEDVWIQLPEGLWKYHAVTDSMTEEQAKVLVRFYGSKILKYENYDNGYFGHFNTAIESLNSLLHSHGIDPTEKWVLLIKE